jgi:hypothetical protein
LNRRLTLVPRVLRGRREVDRGVLGEEGAPFPVDPEEEVDLRLVRIVGRELLAVKCRAGREVDVVPVIRDLMRLKPGAGLRTSSKPCPSRSPTAPGIPAAGGLDRRAGPHELEPGLLHEERVLLRMDQLAEVDIGGKLVSGLEPDHVRVD